MRVGFFLGAGCPVSIRVPAAVGTQPLIPNIEGLTDAIRTTMSASLDHSANFASILAQLGDSPTNRRTIEHVLTRIRGILDVVGVGNFAGMDKSALSTLDKAVCDAIDGVMRQRLPARSSPYHQLAAWIGSIPRAHPVEVFTSNYDLLMEQAFEECGVPYFDGFSGSDQTFFDVPSMEQSTLPSRWARLWKVHGSINWWRTKDGLIQRRERGGPDSLQMIHPSHLKYLESRKMPYLAMHDRLRAFLARGQAVLVTCGYSFLDDHLTEAILDGLSGNPTAVCFGLVFGDRATAKAAIEKVGHRGNLRLLGADGGVLGTIDREWHSKPKPDDPMHGMAVGMGNLGARSLAPDDRCKFLLGDFESLGRFMGDQLASREHDSGEGDAA
ncbi:MAG: SIR2 family protein [Pseudomonadota bacterium]|nr:SIR2 family protein [Pseudomonadota bacterium]